MSIQVFQFGVELIYRKIFYFLFRKIRIKIDLKFDVTKQNTLTLILN